jgi:hypothetical protein
MLILNKMAGKATLIPIYRFMVKYRWGRIRETDEHEIPDMHPR